MHHFVRVTIKLHMVMVSFHDNEIPNEDMHMGVGQCPQVCVRGQHRTGKGQVCVRSLGGEVKTPNLNEKL